MLVPQVVQTLIKGHSGLPSPCRSREPSHHGVMYVTQASTVHPSYTPDIPAMWVNSQDVARRIRRLGTGCHGHRRESICVVRFATSGHVLLPHRHPMCRRAGSRSPGGSPRVTAAAALARRDPERVRAGQFHAPSFEPHIVDAEVTAASDRSPSKPPSNVSVRPEGQRRGETEAGFQISIVLVPDGAVTRTASC